MEHHSRIGFIGLGHMGQAVARNLIKSGYRLSLYNRTHEKAEKLATRGTVVADTPAKAAAHADVLMTLLTDDHAVEAVLFGEDGALAALRPGGLHIGMSTISVALSERLTEAHRRMGQHYIAAPVLGRPEAAAERRIYILAAGPPAAIHRARPLFDAIAQTMFPLGEHPSMANTAKLATNFLLAAMLESLGEAFALIRSSAIDPQRYLEMLTSTLFAAPAYQTYGPMIVEEKFEPAGFAMPIGLKDVGLVLDAAASKGIAMPLAELIREHFVAGIAAGMGKMEWAAIAKLAAQDAGL